MARVAEIVFSVVGETSVVPSGLRIETLLLLVVSVTVSVIDWPAVPLNVAEPFCPGVLMVRVTPGPPAAIVADTSGGTS